ncbi:MAG: hypothetical protein IPO41_05535 [Acidobacteria bacterium]|nr:hypothetical protein [Acidobacteriota bacterium]
MFGLSYTYAAFCSCSLRDHRVSTDVYSQTPEKFAEVWDKEHVSNIFPSDARHTDVKRYLDGLKKLGIKVDQVGFSNANREIYQVEWGSAGRLRFYVVSDARRRADCHIR